MARHKSMTAELGKRRRDAVARGRAAGRHEFAAPGGRLTSLFDFVMGLTAQTVTTGLIAYAARTIA